MKNFLLIIFLILSINLSGQTVSEKFDKAMQAYNSGQYSVSIDLFDQFFTDYKLIDEVYAAAKYYYADALSNVGNYNAAAGSFEFFINNYKWSSFREKAIYKLGLIYYKIKLFDNCRRNMEKLLKEYPGSEYTGSALYWIGESFIAQNRSQDAIRYLKEAVENNKDNKYTDFAVYTLASLYEEINDYRNAVKYYDMLLSYYHDSPLVKQAQTRIAICYFKLKDYQSSIIELNNPDLKSVPKDMQAENLYLLANSYYRVKDYDKAVNTYREILMEYPSSEFIRNTNYGMAWAYFQQKKYNEAYNVFNSLSTGSDSIAINSFFWKAETKRYAGQDEAAYNLYREFLRRYPDNKLISDVQFQLGIYYYGLQRFDLAQKYLNGAKVSDDSTVKAKAFNLLGEIDLEIKQYAAAANDFKQVLNLKSVPIDLRNRAILGIGSALYYTDDFKGAAAYLSDLSSQNPDFEPDKVNFYLAGSYYSLEKYSDAIKSYDKISSSDTDLSASSLYGKGYCYFGMKDFENASAQFSGFVKKYPNDPRIFDAKLRLADSYFASKNFNAASRIYKEIFNLNSAKLSDPYTFYQYAQALYRAGKSDEAMNEFRNLEQRFPSSEYADEALYTVGWIYFQQNQFDNAIITYRNVLSKYPNSAISPIAYYSIGDSYYNMGKYDSAIVNYEKVISLFPKSSYVFDAINGIQYSYVAIGQPNKAINIIDNFVANNPNLSFSDQLYFKKGEIYYSARDYKNAKISYQQFVSNYPKSKFVPDAYYWIGKSSEMLKDNNEAIFNFNKVFTDYPKSEIAGAAVIEMGNVYNSLGDYDSAVQLYNKAIDELGDSPRIPEIMYNKGETLVNKKSFSEAYKTFAGLTQFYSGSVFGAKSELEMGIIDIAANNYSTADSLFSELAQNRSDDIGAEAQYYLGYSSFNQGQYNDAITELNKVRTIFPGYDEWLMKSYILLGDTYVKLNDSHSAKEMYRAVITKHRQDQLGKLAQQKLREVE